LIPPRSPIAAICTAHRRREAHATQTGLRSIVVSDGTVGIRGVRWTEDDTSINTPSATAIAATFDTEVARSMGHVIGAEARRKGVDVILGPVVNLQRSPFGGRHFEAFSEDPRLTLRSAPRWCRACRQRARARS
jgi:beta-glucosidase-like glycosyl hydrolase